MPTPSRTGSPLRHGARACSGAEPVVVEELLGLGPWPPRSCPSRRSSPQIGGERELLVLDPVPLPQGSSGSTPRCDRQLVHHPLDGERGLRAARAAVRVGRHLGGEHPDAAEPVRRELVDGVEHERTQHRYASPPTSATLAQVGQQVDLETGDPSRPWLRRGVSRCHWSRPWCARHQRLRAGLGVLDRLAQPAGEQEDDELLRRRLLQVFSPKPPPTSGAMTRRL